MTTTRTQIRDLKFHIQHIRHQDKTAQKKQLKQHEARQMRLSIAYAQLEHLTNKPTQTSL